MLVVMLTLASGCAHDPKSTSAGAPFTVFGSIHMSGTACTGCVVQVFNSRISDEEGLTTHFQLQEWNDEGPQPRIPQQFIFFTF
jgi:hypothetical protein